MLPKTNRLQKKKDIENVLKKGKSLKEDFLILKTIKNNLKVSRFGFIISKKVSKKANIRNKIKRRLSELVRLKMKTIKKGIDCLLITVPGLETKDFWEIEEIVNNLFKKSGIVKK
jgi:ribonuclease P protein component